MHWNNCWSNSYKNINKFFLNKSFLTEELFARFFYESTFKFFFFKIKEESEGESDEENNKHINNNDEIIKNFLKKGRVNKKKKKKNNLEKLNEFNKVKCKEEKEMVKIKLIERLKRIKKSKGTNPYKRLTNTTRDIKPKEINTFSSNNPTLVQAIKEEEGNILAWRESVLLSNNTKDKTMFAISIVKENIRIKNRSKSKYSLRSNPKEVKRIRKVQKNYSFSKVWFIKFNNFILMNFFVYYYLKIKKKKYRKQLESPLLVNPMVHTFFKKQYGTNKKRSQFLYTINNDYLVF